MTTDDRLKVIKVIFKMFWQSAFSASCLVAFFIVLIRYIYSPTTFDAVKLGAMEAFLAGTVYLGFKFWLPNKSSSKDKDD